MKSMSEKVKEMGLPKNPWESRESVKQFLKVMRESSEGVQQFCDIAKYPDLELEILRTVVGLQAEVLAKITDSIQNVEKLLIKLALAELTSRR
jgi:hypothetical protein